MTNNLSDTETNSKAIALNRFKKNNSPVLATSRNAKQSRVATTFNSRGLQPTDESGNPSSRVATIQPVDNEANIEPELAIGTAVNQANVIENDIRMEEADLMTPRYQQSIAPYPLASATPLLVAQDKPHKQVSRYYIALSPRLTWQQSLYKVQTTTESGTQTLTPNRQDNPGLELALRGGVALRSWLSTGIEIGVNRFASRYTTYVTSPVSNQSIVTNRSTDNSYSIDALPGVVDVPTEQKQLDVRAQLNTQAFIDLHPNHRRYGLDLGAGFNTGIYQGLTTTIAGSSNTLRQPTGQVQPMGQALAYIRLWQHGNNSLRIEGGLRIAPDRYQTAGEGVSVHRRQAVAGLQLHF